MIDEEGKGGFERVTPFPDSVHPSTLIHHYLTQVWMASWGVRGRHFRLQATTTHDAIQVWARIMRNEYGGIHTSAHRFSPYVCYHSPGPPHLNTGIHQITMRRDMYKQQFMVIGKEGKGGCGRDTPFARQHVPMHSELQHVIPHQKLPYNT